MNYVFVGVTRLGQLPLYKLVLYFAVAVIKGDFSIYSCNCKMMVFFNLQL